MARITLGFRIYPDIDDTPVVVLALLEARPETEVRSAVNRAVERVLASADALVPLNDGRLKPWRPSLHVVLSCACHAHRSLGLVVTYALSPRAA